MASVPAWIDDAWPELPPRGSFAFLRSRGERDFNHRGTLAGGPRGYAEARRGKRENVPVHVRASRFMRAVQEVSWGRIRV